MSDESSSTPTQASTSASAQNPVPPSRIVRGTAAVDDLDAFLSSLDEIASETGAVVQAFDADLIVSDAHLREATRLAARSIARNEAVARDPGVEILLYAAGRRQIDRAFALGVAEGERRIAVLIADFGEVTGADRPPADLDAALASAEGLVDTAPPERSVSTTASTEEPPERRSNPSATFDAERVREFYDISARELSAVDGDLADIVRERVALLDVEK
ncbi:KEOPS complex subunit Cgi121 [Halorubrum trueperi]|uniref:KEOPS complex subunit Cgi121 n=1 Tax=Halorubrum trueperi TaxID=2004704 RepID=A0ABD5UGF9_9EURY